MALKQFKSKKECINHIRKSDPDSGEYTADILENMVFKHHHTYALTPYGKFILSKYYEHYILPYDCKSLKEKVMLNRVIDTPYHYCSKAEELTMFDNEIAFLVKLCGGVSEWLQRESSMKVK